MRIVNGWVRVVLGLSAASALTLGASWTEVDAGLPRSPAGVTTVVIDPGSPSTVYALGGSLFKSTDGGGTWDMAGGVSSVSALVIDPSDSSTLYAVAHGTVVKSADGAQSWMSMRFPLASASALAIDPQNTSTVYAASGGHFQNHGRRHNLEPEDLRSSRLFARWLPRDRCHESFHNIRNDQRGNLQERGRRGKLAWASS